MKKKTYNLTKLERNRYSILTDNLDECVICGSPYVEMHEVYGGKNRRVSKQNGFCVPLCRRHHDDVTNCEEKSLFLKRKMQKKFEEANSREEFIKLIGKNYLE